MSRPTTCFFAYSANPRSLADTIERAIDEINVNPLVEVYGWKSIGGPGKNVLNEVCAAIDDYDLFACDVTEASKNVLFELGYAIAKNKRVWIALDSSYPQAKRTFKRLDLLASIECAYYSNYRELATRFFSSEPFNDLSSMIVEDNRPSLDNNSDEGAGLLCIMSEVNTDASIKLVEHLETYRIDLVIDDPRQAFRQPLVWYIQQARSVSAVVAHLLDEERESQTESLHNDRCSLVSGLVYGLEKPLLILAHAPFTPPVDYRVLVQVHETAEECCRIVDTWLSDIGLEYSANLGQGTIATTPEQKQHQLDKAPSASESLGPSSDSPDRYIVEIHNLVDRAYKLFDQEYVRPSECDQTVEDLHAAKEHVQELSYALAETLSLSESLAQLRDLLLVSKFGIEQQISAVILQINGFRDICLEPSPQSRRRHRRILCNLGRLIQKLQMLRTPT